MEDKEVKIEEIETSHSVGGPGEGLHLHQLPGSRDATTEETI